MVRCEHFRPVNIFSMCLIPPILVFTRKWLAISKSVRILITDRSLVAMYSVQWRRIRNVLYQYWVSDAVENWSDLVSWSIFAYPKSQSYHCVM